VLRHPLRWAVALLTAALAVLALAPSFAAAQGGTADLVVDKSGPATTAADADITYTITVSNAGPDASDAVTLTDDLPADTTFVSLTQDSGPAFTCTTPGAGNPGTVSCTSATLANGASATFTLVVHTDPGIVPAGFVTNTAVVSTTGFDPAEENDQSSTSAFVTGGTSADLAVTVQGPDAVPSDTDIAYDVTVRNLGPDAADVTLTDVLPGDLTFVSLNQTDGPIFSCTTPAVGTNGTVTCTVASLASAASATIRIVARVPGGTPSGTEYTNAPAVSTTATDPDTDNDTAATTATISETDLSTALTAPADVTAGDTVTYGITFANAGPDVATDASVFVALPANTTFVSFTQGSGQPFTLGVPSAGSAGGIVSATRGAWASGETATFTLVLRVDEGAPDGPLVTVARGEASTADPDASNDSASGTTTVEALPPAPDPDPDPGPGPSPDPDPDPSPDPGPPTTPVTPIVPAPAAPAPPTPAAPAPAPRPMVACRSTRRVTFTFERRKRLAPRRITVAIDGETVRRYGPRLKATASLVGRTAGRYEIVVTARYRGGKTIRRTSTISTCID